LLSNEKKKKKDELKILQDRMKQNEEFAEMRQRERDDEKEKWQSDQDKKLIERAKRQDKTKKGKAAKKKKEIEEPEILDVSEWKIVGKYMDPTGPMFEVDMTGVPNEEGQEGHFATRKDLVADNAGGIVDEYIRTYCNISPWKELLLEEYEDKDETNEVIAEEKNQKKRKREVEKEAEEETKLSNDEWEGRTCRHDVYELSVTYVPEENAGYCKKEGYYLFGTTCASCSKQFVADRKGVTEAGPGLSFRASSDKPIYCCINVRGNGGSGHQEAVDGQCDHALCFDCWTVGVLKEGTPRETKRARYSRK
jgi:hypothetical protein